MINVKRLSSGELSALFSNLAKGCEKQYRQEESELFRILAEYYRKTVGLPETTELDLLESMVKEDIAEYSAAKKIIKEENDRGALRALVWSEKVSKIAGSLISRYLKSGNKLLEETNIHVCEVCGFVYLGDEPPDVCPVCKVPKLKIAKIRRR